MSVLLPFNVVVPWRGGQVSGVCDYYYSFLVAL